MTQVDALHVIVLCVVHMKMCVLVSKVNGVKRAFTEKGIIMGEVKQLNIRKVSKFDSDFIFSITIKVKAIYTNIYEDKKCEAIVSFLGGRDIGVVKGDKLVMDIGGATFSSILFSDITDEYVRIKTPAKSKIKSDIKKGVDIGINGDLVLDVFKKEIRTRF